MTTTKVKSEDPVAAAEQEAAEADALVAALEERVRAGDDQLTPDEIASAEQVARFARLRADAARRKATAETERIRVAAIAKLDAEQVKLTAGEGDRLVGLLESVTAAVVAFKAGIDQHNAAGRAWFDARSVLDPSTAPVRPINPEPFIAHALGRAQAATGIVITAKLATTDGILDGLSPSTSYAPPPAPTFHYRDDRGVTFTQTYPIHPGTLKAKLMTDVTAEVRAAQAAEVTE